MTVIIKYDNLWSKKVDMPVIPEVGDSIIRNCQTYVIRRRAFDIDKNTINLYVELA